MNCPHLNCLVYHPNGVCTCDMARYCPQCKEKDSTPKQSVTTDEKFQEIFGKFKVVDPPKQAVKQEWEERFDNQFGTVNDCSGDFTEHLPECQGCIALLIQEPGEVKDFISTLLSSQKQHLLDRVREEVIGKDEEFEVDYYEHDPYEHVRNELRDKQRTALKKIEGEV